MKLPPGYFWLAAAAIVFAVFAASRFVTNDYFFFAVYIVLQYVVMATAWNILGGYTGYVNFGSAGFYALGAYSTVVMHKLAAPPIAVSILVGGLVAGAVGLGMGYLTLRLRGIFFAIATLALAIVLETVVANWDYAGGAKGVYTLRPALGPFGHNYIQYLFLVMLILAALSVCIARTIEHSKLGDGLATIRDDELAAEAAGVPTLKLKLIATTLSGALMGMAGAPFPYYVIYLDPSSAFNLSIAVNSIAMPLIGGTASWLGPVIGAVLLATIQQVATVTISSELNLLIVGVIMVLFVVAAPNGIIGWFGRSGRSRRRTPWRHPPVPAQRPHSLTRPPEKGGMTDTLLRVEKLGKRFDGFVALDSIDFRVAPGERVGLIGPNGSGKSTLVNCISGALRNERGKVLFNGRRMDGLSAHTRTRLGLARSFQLPKPFHSMTVAENIHVPLLYTVNTWHGARHLTHAEIETRVEEVLTQVGLHEKAGRRPRDLTQIEMRKLELARAMAAAPKLLIADEAMAGLSNAEVDDILSLLVKLNEQGITVVLIEHIMRAVMSFSQRLVVLVAGRKLADGAPQDVMRNPEVVRAYLGE